MNEEFKFPVNIPRPYPGTGDNEKIIAHVEPLRKAEEVMVSSAYWFNLNQFNDGKEPSLSPGFKYMFWFKNEDAALEFAAHYGVQVC